MAIRIGSGRGSLRPNASDPFTDLLFNTLIGFVLLFFVAIIFLNPEEDEAAVDLEAEYVITVTWPDNSPDDIDTWVEDPRGSVAWFRNPNACLVHLDRDDRGMLNDTITIGGETVVNPLNQEVVAIRGVVPGEYTVNLHYYESETNAAVNVAVRVAKVNPVYKIVFYKSIELARKGVERTAVRFTLAGDGTVIETNTLQKKLVRF